MTPLLLVLAVAPAGAAAPVSPVTARQLVWTVGSALAGAAQTALDPKAGLDRTRPGFAPFWNALQGMQDRVSRIESALQRRDGELFLLIDQGSTDLGALRVAWARAGASNPKVAEGIRIASASYRLLRANYGREGLRHRQGGGLSDAERRHFERVQRGERRFAESLQPLRERARRLGDETTAAELERFRSEAERIAWAPLGLEAYLNALIANGEMRGEWEADAPYIRKDAPEEHAAADATVEDLYVESDIGQVFTVDLSKAGWSSLEQETEVPAERQPAAGAVQVYQLAQGEAGAPAAGEIAPGPGVVEDDASEGEPDEEMEAESVADPEGLEQTAAALDEGEILEEEDLPAGETAATPEADPASPSPASTKDIKDPKDSKKAARPKPANRPPAEGRPVSPPIGSLLFPAEGADE